MLESPTGNGKNFTFLNNGNPVYTAPAGTELRDASIFKHTNGKYYVAHTSHDWSNPNGFDILESANKITWTKITTVNVPPNPYGEYDIAVWAPEWFIDSDGSVHIIVAVSYRDENDNAFFRFFEFHPTSETFTEWSLPEIMQGVALPGFPEPYASGGIIDPYLLKEQGIYYLFYKRDEDGYRYIECASSTNLITNYDTAVKTGNWAGWGKAEGPCLIRLPTGKWRMYLVYIDNEEDSRFLKVCCSDFDCTDWETLGWTEPAIITDDKLLLTPGHGTVIEEREAELIPTGERGRAKWNLQQLLAECPTFQNAIGATGVEIEKIAAAKLRLHISAAEAVEEDPDGYEWPLGLICSMGSDTASGSGVNQFLHGGDIEFQLEDDIPDEYAGDPAGAERNFENFYEAFLAEATALSGQPGYFAINNWRVIEGPTRKEVESGVWKYNIRILINWGLS